MDHTHKVSTMPRIWISPYIPLKCAIGEFEALLAQNGLAGAMKVAFLE